MSVKAILLIVWFIVISLLAYYSKVQIFGRIEVNSPILRILLVLIAFPIIGILFIYIGKLLAYPLTYFFNF